MSNKVIALIAVVSVFLCACNPQEVAEQKFTGINTLSYTDVTYAGVSDTAIVSTYSGRIAWRTSGSNDEKIIAQLDDEVYAIRYIESKGEIAASTMTQGVIVVDANTGDVKRKLAVGKSWINNLELSEDGHYLMGFNGDRESFVWDVMADYSLLSYPRDFPESVVRFGKNSKIYHSSARKLLSWDPKTNSVLELKKPQGLPMDIDENGTVLLMNYDEFSVVSKDSSVAYTAKHPDWPFYIQEEDIIERIPLQMKLTVLKFADNTICSGGIDRSVRFWDTTTGELKGEMLEHRATISAMAISRNDEQIVSVDLKGGIHFTDIKKVILNK